MITECQEQKIQNLESTISERLEAISEQQSLFSASSESSQHQVSLQKIQEYHKSYEWKKNMNNNIKHMDLFALNSQYNSFMDLLASEVPITLQQLEQYKEEEELLTKQNCQIQTELVELEELIKTKKKKFNGIKTETNSLSLQNLQLSKSLQIKQGQPPSNSAQNCSDQRCVTIRQKLLNLVLNYEKIATQLGFNGITNCMQRENHENKSTFYLLGLVLLNLSSLLLDSDWIIENHEAVLNQQVKQLEKIFENICSYANLTIQSGLQEQYSNSTEPNQVQLPHLSVTNNTNNFVTDFAKNKQPNLSQLQEAITALQILTEISPSHVESNFSELVRRAFNNQEDASQEQMTHFITTQRQIQQAEIKENQAYARFALQNQRALMGRKGKK